MYCRNCGKELDDETVICIGCGTLIDTTCKINRHKNGMAIAGFVCSFFIPLLGWIFGGVGLSRANKRDGRGKGFSIAALAISTAMFFIGLAI